MNQENQPKRQTRAKRGKVWVDSTLQVTKSWLRKAVIKEHKDIIRHREKWK